MAQLRDTLIQGSARVTDTLYANKININDTLFTKKLLISSTDAEEHIQFSRTSNINYILFPNNTSTGVGIGYAVGTAYCPLIVTKSSVYPGGTTSTISLGSTDNRWNGVYSSTGNFTGTVTADQLSTNTFLNFRRSDGPSYIMLPDSKDLIINNGNTNGTAYANLQIGKTGITNAYGGSLGSSVYPWGSLYSKGPSYIYSGNSQWCLDIYIYNKSKNQVAEIYYNSGNADNVTTGQFSFRQYSPKATPDTAPSGFHETFQLPSATADLAENKSYNILTTKSTITVSQGGTGVASFTANSLIMSGNTTTAALTTRAIYDRTTVNALSALATWSNSTSIPTMNTLAYWDGRYQTTNNSSNLTYCNKGAFGNAVTYEVDDATANGALGTGTGLTTERSVYYGLVTVNNASQTRATGIYAPTSAGTANQILVSSGGTNAPTWKATAKGAAYATSSNGALTFGLLPIAQGGTEASSAANARANLDVSARIGTGTINLPNYLCLPGFLTDSKKQLRFTYYAGGEINASSATITGNCYIVGVNGKMVGSTMTQTNDAIAITSCGTITLTINKPTRSIQIYINDSGGFKNSTNNTPVAIVSYGLKITLS